MKNSSIKVGNVTIQPGERVTLALPTPEIYSCAPIYLPIHVLHGRKKGPVLLICGGMHGDELNGVAITEKLLNLRLLRSIHGTLLVIPSINIYGMMTLSRNLPDRRDIEGSFPGSSHGSFASRLAHLLTEEVFSKITHCIDIHTGEPHHEKIPHVKANLMNQEVAHLASHFRAYVSMQASDPNEGLLWLEANYEKQIPTLIYETGEALRLDSKGIKIGVRGIIRVMRFLEMVSTKDTIRPSTPAMIVDSTTLLHAPSSGLCELETRLGKYVKKSENIGKIYDPFGSQQKEKLISPVEGIITTVNNLPMIHEGEPIVEISCIKDQTKPPLKEWASEAEEL